MHWYFHDAGQESHPCIILLCKTTNPSLICETTHPTFIACISLISLHTVCFSMCQGSPHCIAPLYHHFLPCNVKHLHFVHLLVESTWDYLRNKTSCSLSWYSVVGLRSTLSRVCWHLKKRSTLTEGEIICFLVIIRVKTLIRASPNQFLFCKHSLCLFSYKS